MRPNSEQMAKYYKDYSTPEFLNHRYQYEPDLKKTVEDYTEDYHNSVVLTRKNAMFELFNKFIDVSKIENLLDFGGRGDFIPDEFKDTNKFVYDISTVQPEPNVTSITDKNDLKNYRWDMIMCNHVLEHVSDPKSYIDELVSYLPVGGYLYIELPYEEYLNNEGYQCSVLNMLRRIYKRPRYLVEGLNSAKYANIVMHEHINFFRPQTMTQIFKNYEIEILENSICKIDNLIGQNAILRVLLRKK